MKIVTNLLAGTALVFATGAVAQGQTAPTGTMNNEMPSAQQQRGTAQAAANFSDTEIESFATATIKLQQLEGDMANNQQEAAQIVAQSGIDVQTFNAISQATRTDPQVAERVQLAVAKLQDQSAG